MFFFCHATSCPTITHKRGRAHEPIDVIAAAAAIADSIM